jgi:tetratricopeptide (TPR) repeat protein
MTIEDAIQLRSKGQYEASRAILDQLLLFAPDDALIHFQLAVTHCMEGNEADALAHYRSAIDAGLPDAEEGQAMLVYASTLRSQGRFLEAARFLREATARRPDDDGLRAFLALTLHKLGMHAEAVQLLIRLLVSSSASQSVQTLGPVLSFYADSLDQRRAQ